MLCGLASPCFLMWVSKGGQYKTRGNVISFSQNVTNLYSTLPRLPEHLDVLVVRKPDARNPASYKDFCVRKRKVFDLLFFLKEHNPFYSDIDIRDPVHVDLPIDGDILACIPHVVASDRSCASSFSDDPDAVEEETYEPEELVEEQTSFLRNPSCIFTRTYRGGHNSREDVFRWLGGFLQSYTCVACVWRSVVGIFY